MLDLIEKYRKNNDAESPHIPESKPEHTNKPKIQKVENTHFYPTKNSSKKPIIKKEEVKVNKIKENEHIWKGNNLQAENEKFNDEAVVIKNKNSGKTRNEYETPVFDLNKKNSNFENYNNRNDKFNYPDVAEADSVEDFKDEAVAEKMVKPRQSYNLRGNVYRNPNLNQHIVFNRDYNSNYPKRLYKVTSNSGNVDIPSRFYNYNNFGANRKFASSYQKDQNGHSYSTNYNNFIPVSSNRHLLRNSHPSLNAEKFSFDSVQVKKSMYPDYSKYERSNNEDFVNMNFLEQKSQKLPDYLSEAPNTKIFSNFKQNVMDSVMEYYYGKNSY